MEPRDEFLGRIVCSADVKAIAVEPIRPKWGVSLQGPISDETAQGVIEATRALRPLFREFRLPYDLVGNPAEMREWTLKGVVFEHTHHEIYVVRQAVPAQNELTGYVNVEVPYDLQVEMTSEPCPAGLPPSSVLRAITPPTITAFANAVRPPDEGVPPLISYGIVKVYRGGGLFATALVRPGETVIFGLPPGSYEVKASVLILTIPFEIPAGSFSGDKPILLSVTLLVVEILYYIMLGVLILAAIYATYRGVRSLVRRGRAAPPVGPV